MKGHQQQLESFWTDEDIIHVYTRAQAIEDGYIVDVTATARKFGFSYPVGIALEAYKTCVEWDEDQREGINIKKTENRLGSLLRLVASLAVRTASDRIYFDLRYEDRESSTTKIANLVSVCGPGDTMAPVITIMFPHEE